MTSATAAPSAADPQVRDCLLDDDQVLNFIARGYHLIDNPFDPALNAAIDAQCSALTADPGDGILDAVPLLQQIFDHPLVRGPILSLCGDDMAMNSHRHCHTRTPNRFAHNWHTDSSKRGVTDLAWILAMYYPHDVTPDMGPTVILPGSQFKSATNPTLESFANIRGQLAMAVPAGTLALVHPNIWHGAAANLSDRPRHMLKFLFDRVTPNTKPNWNHDPATAPARAKTLLAQSLGPCDRHDLAKEVAKRHSLWHWLLGDA